MKATLQRYIDLVSAGDVAGVVDLYADSASVEDPVGAPAIQGKEAVRKFYIEAMKYKPKLKLVAPIRGSMANAAAMAFDVKVSTANGHAMIRVIDVMTFDEQGKITSMHAYWGPDDYITG